MKTFLDDIALIDWSDFAGAAQRTQRIVRLLGNDPVLLGRLVGNAMQDPALFSKCEHHELLDKLVIYDDLERGLRIRLHLSTNMHKDRPHDHRFSFSSYIVRGGYRHTWYDLVGDPEQTLDLISIKPRFETNEARGSCYTLHHSIVHTTFTTPDTISVFLRGPAEKQRSIIGDLDTGRTWWRYGEQDESAARRQQVSMQPEQARRLVGRLAQLGVVAGVDI